MNKREKKITKLQAKVTRLVIRLKETQKGQLQKNACIDQAALAITLFYMFVSRCKLNKKKLNVKEKSR